jgi:hypothetical protein
MSRIEIPWKALAMKSSMRTDSGRRQAVSGESSSRNQPGMPEELPQMP